MKYKRIPFNMTLAKRIIDGSMRGRLYAVHNGYTCAVTAYAGHPAYVGRSDGFETFDVEFPVHGHIERITFNPEGESLSGYDGYHIILAIEIPVENFYDDDCCNANSGVIEKQEMQKDGHYHKLAIEPIEYILANKLGFCEGNIVKYITRYKDKGGIDDLRKIKVYVDYLIDKLTDET